MSNGTADIIIKGGSAEVNFDDSIYQQDPQNPNRYQNQNKKIVRIVITGDRSFDSGFKAAGYQCEITVSCS
jgi:hypothetical protein